MRRRRRNKVCEMDWKGEKGNRVDNIEYEMKRYVKGRAS